MTNAAHIALSVRSLLWLSDSSCFWWISVLTVLAHFPSSSFSLCFRTFLHPIFLLPLTPLSHHPGLTSQSSHLLCQRLCTHTFFLSSPTSSITLSLPVFLSSFFLHTQSSTCRSSLQQLHFFSSFFSRNISQVDWPLNIIITDSCMNKYNRLFSFLLQLKHMVWSLRDVWFHLKRTGERTELLIQNPAWTPGYLWEARVQNLPCCAAVVYKIYMEENVEIFLFIYTKQTSDLWDCCKTVCIPGLGDIDQLKSV